MAQCFVRIAGRKCQLGSQRLIVLLPAAVVTHVRVFVHRVDQRRYLRFAEAGAGMASLQLMNRFAHPVVIQTPRGARIA